MSNNYKAREKQTKRTKIVISPHYSIIPLSHYNQINKEIRR